MTHPAKIPRSELTRRVRAFLAAVVGALVSTPFALARDGGWRLENEASPYLREHAQDEIEWHPWGAAIFERARDKKKLVLTSIGRFGVYSMRQIEREFFDAPDLAEDFNHRFVCVKVDRDERPDVAAAAYTVARLSSDAPDSIPQDPLILALLPDRRPLWAAYPTPEARAQLLLLASNFEDEHERPGMQARAAEIAEAASGLLNPPSPRHALDAAIVSSAVRRIMRADRWPWRARPFRPPHGVLRLLLDERTRSDVRASKNARDLLEAIVRNGLHDHVGGGFHHETMDEDGRLPRFEKRLDDNALLAWALLRSQQSTDNPPLRAAALGVIEWARRELLDATTGFAAGLDAESGGSEGDFYLWSSDEVRKTLGETPSRRFFTCFELSPRGILIRKDAAADVAGSLETLRKRRERRIRPAVDPRVFTASNGLMISALAMSSRTLRRRMDQDLAQRTAATILERLGPPSALRRFVSDGTPHGAAFLQDYAGLALGLLDLYETTSERRWLSAAQDLVEEAIRRFLDADGGFFETDAAHDPLVMRLKSYEDGEGLSGNGMIALVLHDLARFTGEMRYDELALRTVSFYSDAIEAHPERVATLVAAAAALVASPSKPTAVLASSAAQVRRDPLTLKMALSPAHARRGQKVEARVHIEIDTPWFVHAARPALKSFAPMSIAILDPELAAGAPIYPTPTTIPSAFEKEPLAVYVGQVMIVAPLRVPESASPGERRARVRVRYQPCDRRDCQPPQSVVLESPLFIELGRISNPPHDYILGGESPRSGSGRSNSCGKRL